MPTDRTYFLLAMLVETKNIFYALCKLLPEYFVTGKLRNYSIFPLHSLHDKIAALILF